MMKIENVSGHFRIAYMKVEAASSLIESRSLGAIEKPTTNRDDRYFRIERLSLMFLDIKDENLYLYFFM